MGAKARAELATTREMYGPRTPPIPRGNNCVHCHNHEGDDMPKKTTTKTQKKPAKTTKAQKGTPAAPKPRRAKESPENPIPAPPAPQPLPEPVVAPPAPPTKTGQNPSDSASNSTTCLYCPKTFKNKMARWSHERFCKSGPAFIGHTPNPTNAVATQKVKKKQPAPRPEPEPEPTSDRIPLGSHVPYKDKDGVYRIGTVVNSWHNGISIEPTRPIGSREPVANRRVEYNRVEGYWPKGARNRGHKDMRRDF